MKKFFFSWFTLTLLAVVILYWPSFTTFFTNDDFYFLNISKANNISEFAEFFNPFVRHEGQAMYRPLTTQVFYFFGNSILNKNHIVMHLLSFVGFTVLIYLIYLFAYKLSNNKKISILTAFLYATSAIHFGHLYYLATFQEIGVAIFIFLSLIFYLDKKYTIALISFNLGLMSKETAVIIPPLLILVSVLLKKIEIKKIIPFALILFIYIIIRLKFYGLAQGESYIWDFSGRVVNTLAWYGLWSLNIPESFVDFIGPGFRINPNLFTYWKEEAIQIFSIFIILVSFFMAQVKRLKFNFFLFNLIFFTLSLMPVLFLPLHKFSYYLTVPLFAVVFVVANLITKSNKLVRLGVVILWLTGSMIALNYTKDTHWITNGAKISLRTKNYFDNYKHKGEIAFVGTQDDNNLPWSPKEVVINAISGQDFFSIFYDNKLILNDNGNKVPARQFLGY